MNRRTAIGATLAALALATPAAAKATPMNDSYAVSVASAGHDLGGYHVNGSKDFGFAFTIWDFDVTSRVNWTGNLSMVVGWNSANVREGAALPVGRVSPLQNGTLHVTWTVEGRRPRKHQLARCRQDPRGRRVVCAGAARHELRVHGDSAWPLPDEAVGDAERPVHEADAAGEVRGHAEGAVVSRTLTTTGLAPLVKSNLGLSPAPATDTVTVPCGAPGSPVAYKLGPVHWTPAVSVTQQPTVQIGALDAVMGQVEMPAYVDKPYGPAFTANPKFDLTASGHTTALGTALPNNVAPTIAPMSFSATAGVPERLDADVSARCDVASYVWKFSDGTTAYGGAPLKTFSKPVTGQLKVTDSSGLSATRDFSVDVY